MGMKYSIHPYLVIVNFIDDQMQFNLVNSMVFFNTWNTPTDFRIFTDEVNLIQNYLIILVSLIQRPLIEGIYIQIFSKSC